MFLTDVRVPDANRVGDAGSGWRAVLTTLMSERAAVGSNKSSAVDAAMLLIELARHLERTDDPSCASASPRSCTYRSVIGSGSPMRAEAAVAGRQRSAAPRARS